MSLIYCLQKRNPKYFRIYSVSVLEIFFGHAGRLVGSRGKLSPDYWSANKFPEILKMSLLFLKPQLGNTAWK